MGTRTAARTQEPGHNSSNLWTKSWRESFRRLLNLTLSPQTRDVSLNLQLQMTLMKMKSEMQRVIFTLNVNNQLLFPSLPDYETQTHTYTQHEPTEQSLIIEKLSNETWTQKHFLSDVRLVLAFCSVWVCAQKKKGFIVGNWAAAATSALVSVVWLSRVDFINIMWFCKLYTQTFNNINWYLPTIVNISFHQGQQQIITEHQQKH